MEIIMFEYNTAYSPESQGIDSKYIINVLNKLASDKVDMHSVLISRNSKLIYEAYYAPFTRETPHRLFSCTKSFVSLAIGCLVEEGKLSLSDPITDYFPEYMPTDGFSDFLKQTTIRDMLRMQTPYGSTTYKKDVFDDWVKSFFTASPSHRPGTIFSYDSSASHVLSGLVEKISGKPLLDFIRNGVLKDTGFSKEAYCLTDGQGVSQGGSGMIARPLDLMITAALLVDAANGRPTPNGFPAEYIKEAVSYHVPTFVKGGFLAEMNGYGYYFWRLENNGFMFYGMAGQLALCYPDLDLIIVTTADATDRKGGVQQIYDAFAEELLPYVTCKTAAPPLEKTENFLALKERSEKLTVAALENNIHMDFHKRFKMRKNDKNIKEIEVYSSRGDGYIKITNSEGTYDVKFNFGSNKETVFPGYECPSLNSAAWTDETTLIVRCNLIGEQLGKVFFQFSFSGGRATMFGRNTEETFYKEFAGFFESESEI